MGSALSGFATIGMGQWKASAEAQGAAEDQKASEQALSFNVYQAGRKGNFEAAKTRMQASQLIAKQRTAYSSSGVDTSTGTPLAVMADTRMMSELDALTAENNAALEACGYKQQIAQGRKNLQRKYDAANRESIGSALSGSAQVLSGAAGFGGG